jgi:hypothetical protein
VQVQLVSAIGMHHIQSSQLTRDRRSWQELRRSQREQTSTTARITSFTVRVRWQTSRALRPAANRLCRALERPHAARARRLRRPHGWCSGSLPEKPLRCRVHAGGWRSHSAEPTCCRARAPRPSAGGNAHRSSSMTAATAAHRHPQAPPS